MAQTLLRCKVVLAGDATVGKTALATMFQSKGTTFPKNYKLTAGVDLIVAPVLIPKTTTTVELMLFDSGGQDIFRDSIAPCWGNLGMVALVYDTTNKESFDNCAMWLEMLKKHRLLKDRPIQGVLIGNKGDLQERCVVPSEMAEEWAQSHGLQFFEVSAMPPGRDVDVPFAYLASKWHKAYESKVEQVKSAAGAS
mmetsp:Transcript_9828/g.20483  ORF Transcript_9828/g.20483 Transcript_9828/m.20483 type:complete len:195 (-) Transcript_9828:358-942(-)|eukprot:CAMPEP_0118933650 /NCGR_PEP_ID=MMETSP1169-20130426/12110_1 /TAXON_ID=36882 /ORGANISM="Pyramimonas obovata, Strain CCMP722" /LENGTH=194 /DNA_ID=CAMNT_0006876441 /DNA_START=160 /DNA_END=744 /DNA_ORIENTATION=-